jgi:CheY-like chemotaxis protein
MSEVDPIPPQLPRPRILMVDDRADSLLALEAVLGPLGYELVGARSGAEALEKLLLSEFAAIILDVQMPEMDGIEVARLVRQRERTRHVPIVFLTAISGEPKPLLAGYEAGAIDYLYKPYDPTVLRAKISVLV